MTHPASKDSDLIGQTCAWTFKSSPGDPMNSQGLELLNEPIKMFCVTCITVACTV